LTEEFKEYQHKIVKNARALAEELISLGYRLVSGGTDNHLMLVDLRSKGLTGRDAERALGQSWITVNRNTIPYDPQKPFIASRIRLGTPALTTRGMKEAEMRKIARLIDEFLKNIDAEAVYKRTQGAVKELCETFPLYPERRAQYEELRKAAS
jgi:glycine hydroxymethyltransferase